MTGLDRITFDPHIMGGRASIRGMRITVSLILNLVANGLSEQEILADYPYLEAEDIRHAQYVGRPGQSLFGDSPYELSGAP